MLLFNTISADGGRKCPAIYNLLIIFTCTIILKFPVSNFLSVSVKKIKNLKILLSINSAGHTHFANGCE